MTTVPTQGSDKNGNPLFVGDPVTAPGFDGLYRPGRIESFYLRPQASRNVEREGFTPSISNTWVNYREVDGLRRLLFLHEIWVKGPSALEHLAGCAEETHDG